MAQFSLVAMTPPTLLAVPNVSEGRDEATIRAIGHAFAADRRGEGTSVRAHHAAPQPAHGVRLLDVHSDPDHHRSVFTLAGAQGELAQGLLAGARVAVEHIDVMSRADGERADAGQHPHVGALDVVPLVYVDPRARGAACAEALVVADRIAGELGVPVFLYGELSGSEPGSQRTRAELRRGGVRGLAERMADGLLRPDFGPPRLHPTAGATLLGAREPLVAFNVQLAGPASVADARAVAALIREGGREGLPGVRAIGVALAGPVAQVSMNIERPLEVPLAAVIDAVARHAEPAAAELVGLAPRAALEGFPAGLAMAGFDPERHLLENALGC